MLLISKSLNKAHIICRNNKWLWFFALFCRVTLAIGFIPSGLVKVVGTRFTALSSNHPMGSYLDALFNTGFYYSFIGWLQLAAAVLLLIPATATLGAIIYFPIILNICVLSIAVRFDGSLVSSSLMVLANLFLLCWDYHKIKWIFPFNYAEAKATIPSYTSLETSFPWKFAIISFVATVIVIVTLISSFSIKPYNTLKDCTINCTDATNKQACETFCNCIHIQGKPLKDCLEEYNKQTAKKN